MTLLLDLQIVLVELCLIVHLLLELLEVDLKLLVVVCCLLVCLMLSLLSLLCLKLVKGLSDRALQGLQRL